MCVCLCASKMAAGHSNENGLPPLECFRHVGGQRDGCCIMRVSVLVPS